MSPNYVSGYRKKSNAKWPKIIIGIALIGLAIAWIMTSEPTENKKSPTPEKQETIVEKKVAVETKATKPAAKPIEKPKTPSIKETLAKKVEPQKPAINTLSASPTQTVFTAATANSISAVNTPINPKSSFSAKPQRIYYYIKIKSQNVPVTIHHNWYNPSGRRVASIPLYLTSDIAHTYSFNTVSGTEKGTWKVETVDKNGNILNTTTFIVEN
ncbi:MAG: DUF2914 domain-containing protein [Candidatus Margulisbacteria bacterium]|nr:DUF2914 domain-containing protein [Candidatus Margulisiibacteriota bacterium]MBU1022189.1 DUF2914 domain-containing protein [Candidatus Margulisiibacteriota bacterium]MBU1729372.1 DUF2914 domain-containing protein [Candidatus Margulisiibacteriota bacterium]MBU1955645.1 DUF2914 domain-containing protein [Candidatus Margulisiibacteriota bacterium]